MSNTEVPHIKTKLATLIKEVSHFAIGGAVIPFTLGMTLIGFVYSVWHDLSNQEIRFLPIAILFLVGVLEMFRHHPYAGTYLMLMGVGEFFGREKHSCNAAVLNTGKYTEYQQLQQLIWSRLWPYGYIDTRGETFVKLRCADNIGNTIETYMRITEQLRTVLQPGDKLPVTFQYSRDALLQQPKILAKPLR